VLPPVVYSENVAIYELSLKPEPNFDNDVTVFNYRETELSLPDYFPVVTMLELFPCVTDLIRRLFEQR